MFKTIQNKAKVALSSILIALLMATTIPVFASNMSYIPLEDDYLQELTQSLGDQATDLVIYVDEVPVYSPTTTDTYAMIEPGTSRQEVVLIDSYDATAVTLTVKAGGRGQNLYLGDVRAVKIFEHPAGSEIMISDNYLFWQDGYTAINSKLDNTGGNATTTFNLSLSGSNWRIRKDGNDMKFRDDNQAEVTLSQLASLSGVNDKVKISVADTTAGYLGAKINSGDGLDEAIGTPGGNETLDLSVDVTDFIDTNYGLTENANDIRVNLAATPGLEFSGGALTTKLKALGGIEKDSDGLYLTSAFYPKQTGVAGETITIGQALAEIPYDCKWYSAETFITSTLGDSNVRRKYAMKFTPAKTVTGIARVKIATAEQVNNSTNLGDLIISVQTDNAGQPSGSLVHANATSTTSQATQRTWNVTTSYRPFSFAGAFGLTKGTTYWLVIECSATDAANYLKLGNASNYDENYPTFTRLIYDLDTSTWGSSSTVLPLFFHFDDGANDVSLGSKLVPTDADFGRKTWNFVGFADAGYSAEATVNYYHDMVPAAIFATPLQPVGRYYIGSTTGQIVTTSSGTPFDYKIGDGIMNSAGTVDLKIARGQKSFSSGGGTGFNFCWFKPTRVNFSVYIGGTTTLQIITGVHTNNFEGYVIGTADDGGAETASWTTGSSYISNLTEAGYGFTTASGSGFHQAYE